MKNYDKDNESSYIMYLDPKNLYGWPVSQKLPINSFKLKKNSTKSLSKNYDKNSNKRCILEVDIEYLKKLDNLHDNLPFLPKRIKIEKCNNFVCNLYEKNKYVAHMRTLKQELNHGLILKKCIK